MSKLQRYGVHIYREASGDDPGANVCTLCEPRPDECYGGPQLVRHVPLDISSKDSAEAFAAGDFIVLACNSHHDMLDALWSVAALAPHSSTCGLRNKQKCDCYIKAVLAAIDNAGGCAS